MNGVMAVILRYFSEFAYLSGVLRKSSCSLSHLQMSSCLIITDDGLYRVHLMPLRQHCGDIGLHSAWTKAIKYQLLCFWHRIIDTATRHYGRGNEWRKILL